MARFDFAAIPRALDSNGNPVSGAKFYVFQAGTTTPVTTYSDKAQTTARAHPVIAGSDGLISGDVYLPDGDYKWRITTADDVTIQEADNVSVFSVQDAIAATAGYTTQQWIDGNAGATLPARLQTSGYADIGDGGGAAWVQVASEPSHNAKKQFSAGTDTEWYELFGFDLNPLMMGAENSASGTQDDADAFNAVGQRAAALFSFFRSTGSYKVQKTIAIGGRVRWDSGDTTLIFDGVTAGNLTTVKENPTGTTENQDSTKSVLVDTKGMERSDHSGILHIRNTIPTNANLASQALIEQDFVGLTCSEGISPSIQWGSLRFSGCGNSFWQGDQRGSGPTVLPYTGWTINELEEFICGPIRAGSAGNAFDDLVINQWRRFRCFGETLFRVSGGLIGNWFNNGKNQAGNNVNPGSFDSETETISTTIDSDIGTLSADNSNIVVGTVLAVRDADVNLDGDAIWWVARVTAKSGTQLTFDRTAGRTTTGAEIIGDPPEVQVETSNLRILKYYPEEIHAISLRILNRGFFEGEVRVSEGEFAGYYGCGILMVPSNNAAAIISLHNRSSDNPNVKYIVGVASLRDGTTSRNSVSVVAHASYARADFTDSRPIGIVKVVGDDVPSGFTESSDHYNPGLLLKTCYAGQEVFQQRFGTGEDAFGVGADGRVKFSDHAVVGGGTGASGGISLASDVITKADTGNGTIDYAVSAETRYCLSVNFSAFTDGQPTVQFFNGGTAITDENFVITNSGGSHEIIFDTPATTTKLQLQGFGSTAWAIDEFTIEKVLST